MITQLYKRKIADFLKLALAATLVSFLMACSQEAENSEEAVSSATPEVDAAAVEAVEPAAMAEEAPAAETDAPQAEQTETVDEAAEEAVDAGFIDYDMVLGDPNAPVEIIEYASLTCNHCAAFHNNVLPLIKEKYVDTGKVKIVMRSFLLNQIDATASLLTRCVPEQRYFRFMDALFARQTQWYNIPEYQRLNGIHDQRTANIMFTDYALGEVSKIARQLGLNEQKIETCLANTAIGEYIYSVQQEGIQKHKVTATPTIIVNGNKTGNDYASIERAIEAALD